MNQNAENRTYTALPDRDEPAAPDPGYRMQTEKAIRPVQDRAGCKHPVRPDLIGVLPGNDLSGGAITVRGGDDGKGRVIK